MKKSSINSKIIALKSSFYGVRIDVQVRNFYKINSLIWYKLELQDKVGSLGKVFRFDGLAEHFFPAIISKPDFCHRPAVFEFLHCSK
jgi:hypothetical protein